MSTTLSWPEQIEPLESEFANTQNRKERELANFLRVIGRLEGELNTANDEHDRQLRAYSALLNEKMRLEQEIATYRRLLEDEMARCAIKNRSTVKMWITFLKVGNIFIFFGLTIDDGLQVAIST